MIKRKWLLLSLSLFSLVLLVSCTSTPASGPEGAVTAYWQAMVDKDKAQLSALSCADYEAEALTTLESFASFEPTLKEISCTVLDETGDTARVACSGSIEVSYGAEILVIDLSERAYTAKKENGDWRMCGAE